METLAVYAIAKLYDTILITVTSLTYILGANDVIDVEKVSPEIIIEDKFEIVEHDSSTFYDSTRELFTTTVVTEGKNGLYLNLSTEKKEIYPIVHEKIAIGTKGAKSFIGEMTTYGLDCLGCNNVTANSYVIKKNEEGIYDTFYEDKQFGRIYMFAADRSIPFGTIMKISNYKHGDENGNLVGVVMDRGGAIKGTIVDLMYPSRDLIPEITRFRNMKFEILRWGW